jgi:hypothetical protein
MRRFGGESGATKPTPISAGIVSMGHITVIATPLATPSAAPLSSPTLRLLPAIFHVAQPIGGFRAVAPTHSTCHHSEARLHATLRELGRIIDERTNDHLEPDDRHLMPDHLRFDGTWYRRRADMG